MANVSRVLTTITQEFLVPRVMLLVVEGLPSSTLSKSFSISDGQNSAISCAKCHAAGGRMTARFHTRQKGLATKHRCLRSVPLDMVVCRVLVFQNSAKAVQVFVEYSMIRTRQLMCAGVHPAECCLPRTDFGKHNAEFYLCFAKYPGMETRQSS